jgi:hypothetical protein
MTKYSVFLSYSHAESGWASAWIRRLIEDRYSAEAKMLAASLRLRREGRTGSGIRRYVLLKSIARGEGENSRGFVRLPSGVSYDLSGLSDGPGPIVIVWSLSYSICEGLHRRRLGVFGKANSGAPARPAPPLTFLTQRTRDALSRVKACFLPGVAGDDHAKEARAAYAAAAARRTAIADSVMHEVAHWCDHAPLQSRRLAASMAATGAPEPRSAALGTPSDVCMAALYDFDSAVPLWPTGLDRSVGPVKGLPVLPALPHATGPFLDAGSIACALSNQNHDPGNADKGLMVRYVTACACGDSIETVPAGMSRQFGGIDMRVPVCGGLLPAVWQPDFPGPAGRGFEAAARPVPVAVTAASTPITAADRWVGADSRFFCMDNNTTHGVCGGFEILGGAGDRVAGTNGMTGSIVSDPDRWELLDGGSGSDFVFFDCCRDTLDGGAGNDMLIGNAGKGRLTGCAGNDTLTGGAGNDIFAFQGSRNGHDTIADFGIMTGHDSVDLWTAFSQNFLVRANAVTPSRTPDVALARSKDAGIHTSYTGWITDAATGPRREGPLIDWDAAAVRRKSNVVGCEITDLFEDDTTAGIFPRRARDLFYGREIAPGDKPAGRADAAGGTAVINFASRKSKKKTPGDIADVAAARQ